MAGRCPCTRSTDVHGREMSCRTWCIRGQWCGTGCRSGSLRCGRWPRIGCTSSPCSACSVQVLPGPGVAASPGTLRVIVSAESDHLGIFQAGRRGPPGGCRSCRALCQPGTKPAHRRDTEHVGDDAGCQALRPVCVTVSNSPPGAVQAPARAGVRHRGRDGGQGAGSAAQAARQPAGDVLT